MMLNVKIDKLSLRNSGSGKIVLRDIHFTLFQGEVISILGKNGQGKTVLIKSLTQLLNPNEFNVVGQVLFEGLDLLKIPESKLNEYRKNAIRYVFQDAANSFDPLRKMKYYFNSINSFESVETEKLLDELMLPSLNEICERYCYEFSVGQLQRISFALALLANPKILILDEPTSAIDVINGAIFASKIKELKDSQKSVIVVTQDIKFALKTCSSVRIISDSKLSPAFKVEDIIKNKFDSEQSKFAEIFKEFESIYVEN